VQYFLRNIGKVFECMEIFANARKTKRACFTKISHDSATFDESPFTQTRVPSAPQKRH
jgi:hypothetical protein